MLAVAFTGVAAFGAAAVGTAQAADRTPEPAQAQVLSAPKTQVQPAARGGFGPSTRDLARQALQEKREEEHAHDDGGRDTGLAELPSKHDDRHSEREVVATGQCEASYYNTGSITANGEPFDPSKLTAAHKSLPFDTMVRVINTANNESVVVRINDRGPYIAGRCLDLTPPGMEKIAGPGVGTAQVRYEVLADG